MISLIISESALELVPFELENHPSVVSHARKLGKYPSEILLDNSWHFAAMKGIKNEIKRGRPDLVHFSILEATTIPLYLQNKLNLFVHTVDDKVIHFGKNVHLPKSYHRFEGVIEKLYQEKKIMTKNELLLAIAGGLFVLEAISVIVQVTSFKLTGKRVFRMAPLHHHFEQKGWSESTIVIRFWIIYICPVRLIHFFPNIKGF